MSHCSSEAFFGPRFLPEPSPLASSSSAGLPSASASRYLASSSATLVLRGGEPPKAGQGDADHGFHHALIMGTPPGGEAAAAVCAASLP
jgi:hypothetical protein